MLPVRGGPGFNTWSGNWIPHVASKSSHAATRESRCRKLRSSTVKKKKKQRNLLTLPVTQKLKGFRSSMPETGEEDQMCLSYITISHPLLPDLFLPLPTSILARVICTHQSLLNHTLCFITHCNITSVIVTLREMTSCCSSMWMFVSD